VLTVLVTATISAVDVVALWLLNLVTDLGTWLNLLFLESVALMFFGSAGGAMKRGRRRRGILSSPEFWVSVGVAGVVLLISAVYVVTGLLR
jgi:hypothetical protein